uniref:Uncharacterized protein n=1 Tax=Rhizophora mucronata TaxID=61149 RepID=A0A2P2NZ21_RHIMU
MFMLLYVGDGFLLFPIFMCSMEFICCIVYVDWLFSAGWSLLKFVFFLSCLHSSWHFLFSWVWHSLFWVFCLTSFWISG